VTPTRPTPSVLVVTPRANEHVRYALNLAERGAVYTAKAEFVMALELVAGALDADAGTSEHTNAIRAGLTALDEADDFAPKQLRHKRDLNLANLATVHRTVILKRADTSRLTPAEALQRYYAYATEQLAQAGGNEPIASMALYGLGRAESVAPFGTGIHSPLGGPKAIALYQAALLVDRNNHLAGNELGVLLARYGRIKEAETALLHSLSVSPRPTTWHNLSVVYQKMGAFEKAGHARRQHESLVAANRARGGAAAESATGSERPLIRCVDPETFARIGTPYSLGGPAIRALKSEEPPSIIPPPLMSKQWIAQRVPWMRQKK
jgi:tetratricopeptide (TPR) repeat protein